MGRPLFLEGEAGVGKTEIAKGIVSGAGAKADPAAVCYEGLDVASAVYEWNSAAANDRDPAGGSGRRYPIVSSFSR